MEHPHMLARVVLILTVSSLLARGEAAASPPRLWLPGPKEQKRFVKLYKAANVVVRDQEEVARELLRILNDQKAWVDNRVAAGEKLGEMRYLPAMPSIVRYIDLQPLLSSELRTYPLHSALLRFGDCAIPTIVDELLKYDIQKMPSEDLTKVRKGRLKYPRFIALSLTLKKLTKDSDGRRHLVRIYLAGVSAITKDQRRRERARFLLEQISGANGTRKNK